jgi:predicted Zn-dependent protease
MLLLGQTVYLDLLQQPDKALPILDELGQRFPTTWHATEAIYMIARIHLDKGERDKAADVLRNRVVLSGTDPIAYHHFGLFCLRYNFLLDEAAARLEAGVVKHPDAAYLWKMLAEVCHRSDKLERAVSAIGEACRLEPANDSYRQLGDVFRRALLKSKERQ